MVVLRGPGISRGDGARDAHRLQPDGDGQRQRRHGGPGAQRQRRRQDPNRPRRNPVPRRLLRSDVAQHRGPDHEGPAPEGRQPGRGRGGAESGPDPGERPAPRQRFVVQDRRSLRQRRGARDSVRGAGSAEQHQPLQGVRRLDKRERHDEAGRQRRAGGRRQRRRCARAGAAHPARPAGPVRTHGPVRQCGGGGHDAGHAAGLDGRPDLDRSDGGVRL